MQGVERDLHAGSLFEVNMAKSDPVYRNSSGDGIGAFSDTITGRNPLQFTVNTSAQAQPKKVPAGQHQPGVSVAREPFDDTFLNHVINLLKTHGPAASKIIFLFGTAAATLYAGLSVASITVRFMIWGCGFILECLFAYSWAMTGDERIAGKQYTIIQRIFKVSSLIMMGDLATMLLDNQAGLHGLFIAWTSGVQPLAAVYLMNQLYRLKASHPETIAHREIINLKASMRAAAIRDKAFQQRLDIAEREHERALQWAALEARHHHGMRLVSSRWYDGQIKRETKQAVGQSVEGAALKMKKLPQLLSIGGEPKEKPSEKNPAKKTWRRWKK